MLFNSFIFLLVFLPITYVVFWSLRRTSHRYIWLAVTGYLTSFHDKAVGDAARAALMPRLFARPLEDNDPLRDVTPVAFTPPPPASSQPSPSWDEAEGGSPADEGTR